MSSAGGKANKREATVDANSNETVSHLLSPLSPSLDLSSASCSDNESWTSGESMPDDVGPLPSWRADIPLSPARGRRRSSIKKPQVQLDPIAVQLNDFYENRVRISLERKEICEEIAYDAVHKCLRKIQTVDDRFRANSLVSNGIPYDGLQAEEAIHIDMIVQLALGPGSALYVALDERTGGMRAQPVSAVEGNVWEDCLTSHGYISAVKVNKLLRKYIRKAVTLLNTHIKDGRKEKLPKNLSGMSIDGGPVIRLTINKDISVDVLPAFVIPDSRLDPSRKDCPSSSHIVAKKGRQNEMIWRLSFHVAEKNKIRALSDGCRVQLLRILTEMRDNEDQLKNLSSYHLKTLLFHEAEAVPDMEEWSADKITRRFFGILERCKKCLKEGELWHYFMQAPDFTPVNLFADFDGKTLSDMQDAIEDISEHPLGPLRTEGRERRMSLWPWEYDLMLPAGLTG